MSISGLKMGDFVVVVRLKDELLVTSCMARIEDTLESFKRLVAKHADTEMNWWCNDHNVPEAPSPEREAIFKAPQFELYYTDRVTGLLTLISDEAIYKMILKKKDRLDRQFAYLDVNASLNDVLPLLEQRLVAVCNESITLRFE